MDFRQSKSSRTQPENLIAMINIIFLLLIFFMLAGTIAPSKILPINAPESVATRLSDDAALHILMSVDGAMALDDQVLSKEQLFDSLEKQLADRSDTLVRLEADGELPAESMLEILNQLGRLGVTSVVLVTEHRQ